MLDKTPEQALKEYPFYQYLQEDLSQYPSARSKGWIDLDDDFLIGNSGGLLMRIDFVFVNTHVFRECATYFEKHEVYTKYVKGTRLYKDFWRRETKRRRDGMVANCKLYIKDIEEYYNPNTSEKRKQQLLHPLRITGDHYNLINYSRMSRRLTDDEIAELKERGVKRIPKKKQGFPFFIDGQYWDHKIDEMAVNNGYNICESKARRKGFSYSKASARANLLNLTKDITCILAAYDITYLTDAGATTDMVKRNLDWLEDNTYWQRGYLSEDYKRGIQLGYKKKKEGSKKFGFKGVLHSVSLRNNESAPVGKEAVRIDFEESGKNRVLQASLNVTLSAAEDGADQIGTISIFGTGGTKDANWHDFSKIFYNCAVNNTLPLENVWDIESRTTTCGFFYPQVWGYFPYVDKDGNSLFKEAFIADYKEKKKKEKTLNIEDWTIFVGQRANSPSEAFINTQDNLFTSPELINQITRVKTDPSLQFHVDGLLTADDKRGIVFKSNEQLKAEGNKIHPYIETVPADVKKDINGCMRLWYHPFKDNEGEVPPDLYFISYDTVKTDKDNKTLDKKNSLNSFKVWSYPNNIIPGGGKRLCASYAGRFNTMEDTDRLILYAAKYWNAKIILEAGSGETVPNFKKWGELKWLLRDPSTILDRKNKFSRGGNYGVVVGDADKKIEGLVYLKEHLYSPRSVDEDGQHILELHYIYDLPFLLELSKFNILYNFDRISDGIVAMFEMKSNIVLKHKKSSNNNNMTGKYKRLSDILKNPTYGNR